MKRLTIVFLLIFISNIYAKGQGNYQFYFGINSITSIASSSENIYIGTDSRVIMLNRNTQSKQYLTPYSITYSQDVPPYFSLNYSDITNNLLCISGQQSPRVYEMNSTTSSVKLESNYLTSCNIDNFGDIWVSGANTYDKYYLKHISSSNTVSYQYIADSIPGTWSPDYVYANFNSIDFDSNNTPWLSSNYGLLNLDLNLTLVDCPLGFCDYQFEKLTIDKYDNKWLTTNYHEGLIKYDNENWQLFNTNNSEIPSDSIFAIDTDSFGHIWIATNKGLAKYDGNEWVVFNSNNSNLEDSHITVLHVDDLNIKWMGSYSNKLIKFDDITFETVELGDYPIENNNFQTLHSSDNVIYAAGYGKSVVSFSDFDLSTHITFADKAADSYFTSLLIDSSHTYATVFGFYIDECGMLLVNGDSSIFYNHQNVPEMFIPNFVNTPLNYLTRDAQGNLWMSISTRLLKYNNDEWVYYGANSGIPQYAFCRGISLDSNDNLIAAFNHVIKKFTNEYWEVVDLSAIYSPDIEIFSFLIDENDHYVIGTREHGIFVYNGLDWQNYTMNNSDLPSNRIWCLEVDSAQNLWAGTDGGLVKYDYEQWSVYSVENSFIPVANVIYDIHIDDDNNVWFVNKAGVTVFNENGFSGATQVTQESSELTVYPNPAKDYLKLDYIEEIIEVEIYSVLGTPVSKEQYIGEIDVANLNIGMYVLKITTESKDVLTTKFVKD